MEKKYIFILVFFIFQSNLFAHGGISSEDIALVTATFIGMPASFVSVILSVGFGMTDKNELSISKFVGMTIAFIPLFLVNLFYFLCNGENDESWINSQNIFALIGLSSIIISYSRLIYLLTIKTSQSTQPDA